MAEPARILLLRKGAGAWSAGCEATRRQAYLNGGSLQVPFLRGVDLGKLDRAPRLRLHRGAIFRFRGEQKSSIAT